MPETNAIQNIYRAGSPYLTRLTYYPSRLHRVQDLRLFHRLLSEDIGRLLPQGGVRFVVQFFVSHFFTKQHRRNVCLVHLLHVPQTILPNPPPPPVSSPSCL